jgi:endonuclease YncB( thermonuclease family)
MQALLNAGPFVLRGIGRDEDRYGRKLRLVMRDGRSLGMVLVNEGIARRYHGQRRKAWC